MNVFRIWMRSFLFLSFYLLNVPGLFSKLAGIQIKTETDVTEWRHGVTPMFYFQIYTPTQVLGWHIIQSSHYSTLKHWTYWNTVLPLHFIYLMFIWFWSYWESFIHMNASHYTIRVGIEIYPRACQCLAWRGKATSLPFIVEWLANSKKQSLHMQSS